MKKQALAVAVAISLASAGVMAQQQGQISGTAKDQAKEPYADYSVRVRDVANGQIGGTTALDNSGAFTVASLPTANYVVELLNKDGKVVCTEGPFDLAQQLIRDGVIVDCNKFPAAFWLLGAGAAAGITAGVVAATGSPSR
jgi:hypothetical protein